VVVPGEQPVEEGAGIDGPGGQAVLGSGLVGTDPVVDDVSEGVRGFGFVGATIRDSVVTEVVTDGALGNAEGVGNLGIGLPFGMKDTKGHDFLRSEFGRHGKGPRGRALPTREDNLRASRLCESPGQARKGSCPLTLILTCPPTLLRAS